MAVQGDVDRLGFEGAQVGGRNSGLRNSKKNVSQIGAHVASGQVGDPAAQSAQQQIDRVGIHAVKGAVHDLRNFVIDAFGHQVQVGEHLGPFRVDHRGRPEHRGFLFVKVGQGGLGHIQGDFLVRPALGVDVQARGHIPELFRCFDSVGFGPAQGNLFQGVRQMFGMAGMGRCTRGNGAVYIFIFYKMFNTESKIKNYFSV